MRNPHLAIGLVCLAVAAALVAGGVLLGGRGDQLPPVPAEPTVMSAVPIAQADVPRHGDCGAFDGASVEPVACSDPRANVEVGARRALGDPAARCPLYDRKSVLATPGGIGSLYVCWVPIGGGPPPGSGTANLVEVTTTEPEWLVGVCGDVHDQYVHAPLSCDDERADGVVTASVVEASRCADGTLLALPASTGRIVCWGRR